MPPSELLAVVKRAGNTFKTKGGAVPPLVVAEDLCEKNALWGNQNKRWGLHGRQNAAGANFAADLVCSEER